MGKQFSGKTIFITGGASGIGKDTCLAFAREGANVAICDLDKENGKKTLSEVEKLGVKGIFIELDVTQVDKVEQAVQKTVDELGGLNFAFNNAGIASQKGARIAEYSDEEFIKVMDVNVMGVWYCMRFELKHMLKSGGGVIINTASILGTVGMPMASSYVASKHAVIGLTKTAALEYATKNIRVNALCPGYINTSMLEKNGIVPGTAKFDALVDMHPVKRLGNVEEISGAVVFMCSDSASFMTGHSLLLDGGFTAR